MSKGTLGQVVKRAISDAAFRRQLQSDPEGALKGFDLTSDERAALRSGDASKLSTFGIDQRMSKAFTMGDGAAAMSRQAFGSELSNSSGAQAAFIDQGSASGSAPMALNDEAGGSVRTALNDEAGGSVRTALNDEAGGSVRSGLISEGTGARTARGDQHDGGRAAIGDNAGGGRTALDNSGSGSREGTAYITADEAGNDSVGGGATASWKSAPIDGGAEGESASFAASDSSATSAFMTADEMGNDASAGSSNPSLSADQRLAGETLDADSIPTDGSADAWAENPEHQG